MAKDIYEDIAKRTGGDIYIGVVGPVRTGKSTLIKQLMEKLVIPNIPEESKRLRAVDELPQSAAGKTIMTTIRTASPISLRMIPTKLSCVKLNGHRPDSERLLRSASSIPWRLTAVMFPELPFII